ncbi:MAG: hypothetical protein MJE12_28920, partial [Alphaproteobacteria bacterium]|nr:hypothetical protein [Alphaproteobacteria bacterium]
MSGAELFFVAASTALGAAQTISQASSEAKLANFNARVAEQNAQAARRQAAADESRQRRQFARSLAKRRTGFSAAGVSLDGSPLDLLEDIATENEIDLLGIRQRGLAQAREFTLAASE